MAGQWLALRGLKVVGFTTAGVAASNYGNLAGVQGY